MFREATISFTTMVTDGITILGQGITEMVKNPIIMGCIGVGIAAFVCRKAVRLLKTR